MISLPLPLQAPFLILLAGIFLCLVFETAGVPEGYRRHGSKAYLTLISSAIIIAIFFLVHQTSPSPQIVGGFIFDSLARSGILSLSVLALIALWLLANRSEVLYGDRGESYALILISYFFASVVCSSQDFHLVTLSIFAWPTFQIGALALGKNQTITAEITLKLIVFIAFMLFLMSFVFLFADMTGGEEYIFHDARIGAIAIGFVVSLISIGAFPLQSYQVDMLDGAPPYAAVFAGGSSIIIFSVILVRAVEAKLIPDYLVNASQTVLLLFASLSLCLGAMLALDQTRIARLGAYLLSSQAGLVLLVCAINLQTFELPTYFYGLFFSHFVLCFGGLYAGLGYWKATKRSLSTWEDFSGAGRSHPIAAGSFILVLSSLCGLPFTSGFVLRYELLELTEREHRLLLIGIIFISTVLSSVPMLRLLAFLFGKAERHDSGKPSEQHHIIILAFCAAALFLISVVPESILISLFS